jgi:hypothetical protein
MTPALLDRLTHHCRIFDMNGESYRFRESMKAKKGRKSALDQSAVFTQSAHFKGPGDSKRDDQGESVLDAQSQRREVKSPRPSPLLSTYQAASDAERFENRSNLALAQVDG